MNKRYAIITDIHGNMEGLNAVLDDIKKRNVDDIFCLGDIIHLGPNSKECIDILMENKIKSILGNHELYLIKGTDIDSSIEGEEKAHYEWVKSSLNDKEIDFIKFLPLYYKINIDFDDDNIGKEIILCHYLIKDEKLDYPFEETNLKRDINLWIKYNDPNIIYIVGHLHKSFDANIVDGIENDYITKIGKLPNIEIVDSAGCSFDEYVSYLLLEIGKSVKFKRIKVKFNRDIFVKKIKELDFPDKNNIMKHFYGIE